MYGSCVAAADASMYGSGGCCAARIAGPTPLKTVEPARIAKGVCIDDLCSCCCCCGGGCWGGGGIICCCCAGSADPAMLLGMDRMRGIPIRPHGFIRRCIGAAPGAGGGGTDPAGGCEDQGRGMVNDRGIAPGGG
jgi:hypothetical protein